MPTVNFTINGKPVSCQRDEMLLDVALANGFEIPALCRHQAHAPSGACRLCLVEITQGRWNWVEASCTYPVRDEGIEVKTDSESVLRYRRLNVELLLARCPDCDAVKDMARRMGVDGTRLPADGQTTCVLCGLCVEVCRDVVGVGAISFRGRGSNRCVETPFGEPSDVCIGCGACAEVCPTGHISVRDTEDGQREIRPFGTLHRLVPCPRCGTGYVTEKQLRHLSSQLGAKDSIVVECPRCRGRRRAGELIQMLDKQLTTSNSRR